MVVGKIHKYVGQFSVNILCSTQVCFCSVMSAYYHYIKNYGSTPLSQTAVELFNDEMSK